MDRWKTWIASATLSCAVIAGVVTLTSQDSDASPADTSPAVTSTAAADATTPVTPVAVTEDEAVEPTTEALDAIATDTRFSVSVLDVDTGEELTYGSGQFDTASIVKVDILAALLHQHAEAGTAMTAAQEELAAAMIERSDNASATVLFQAVGGEEGLEEFNRLIGLTDTDVGADGSWGLTQTTSADQVRLLQVVLGDDSVLGADDRAYVESLMTQVVDAQNFGVSAAADDPDAAALKVGYLQRSATGRWDVTSIGRIEAAGRTYLLAVLSDGSRDLAAGTEVVDAVARAAVADLTAI
jgi:beta-lactamase class A